MILAQRSAMIGSGLPYDSKVEYLEMPYASARNNFKVVFDIRFKRGMGFGLDAGNIYSFNSGYHALAGTMYTKQRVMFYVNSASPGNLSFDWQSGARSPNPNISFNTERHVVEVKRVDATNAALYIDGVSRITKSWFDVPDDANAEIKLIPHGERFSGKIYGFWIYGTDGAKILNAVPARLETKGVLYDTISGNVFQNAGTGTFIIGPDILPSSAGGGCKYVAWHSSRLFRHLFE